MPLVSWFTGLLIRESSCWINFACFKEAVPEYMLCERWRFRSIWNLKIWNDLQTRLLIPIDLGRTSLACWRLCWYLESCVPWSLLVLLLTLSFWFLSDCLAFWQFSNSVLVKAPSRSSLPLWKVKSMRWGCWFWNFKALKMVGQLPEGVLLVPLADF